MRLTDLCSDGKVAVVLWVAETELNAIIARDKDWQFYRKTLSLCWSWLRYKNISSSIFQNMIQGSDGTSNDLVEICSNTKDDDAANRYDSIMCCIMYTTCYVIDNENSAQPYPQYLEGIDDDWIEELITNLIKQQKLSRKTYNTALSYVTKHWSHEAAVIRWRLLRRCKEQTLEKAGTTSQQWKDDLENIFGHGNKWLHRMIRFLQEREFAGCQNEHDRWKMLQKKIRYWMHSEEFIIWKYNTYIYGVYGWNVEITACQLRFPLQWETDKEREDWLCRAALLSAIARNDEDYWNEITESNAKNNSAYFSVYIFFNTTFLAEEGYFSLTHTEWIEELSELRRQSRERYKSWKSNHAADNPEYDADMQKNYPVYDEIVNYLSDHAAGCDVVSINEYGSGDLVWYFARTADSLFVVIVSDQM